MKPTSGAETVAPAATGTQTYTLSCNGDGGSASASTTVTVTPAPVTTVNIAVQPDHIALGNSATLSWSSTNADSCTASGAWSGAKATSGSESVTPTAGGLHIYTLSCAGASSTSASTTLTVEAANATFSGSVLGGAGPIAGAAVAVYASGSSTPLGAGTTVADGSTSFAFANPGGDAVLYVLARGGDAGQGANAAIALGAVLGTGAAFASPAVINERTTVAGVWALAQFFGANGIAGAAPGLQNAAATAANLAEVATGNASSVISAGNNAPDKLNTLANLLAACVESAGASSSQCSDLFANATVPPQAAPGDTLAAALAVARNPGRNVAALFALANGNAAYAPALGAAPNDWTLALNYTGGGLADPAGIAFDAAGNLWVANFRNAVSKFSPTGQPLFPSGIRGGGLFESFSLAVDALGNVWVTNNESPRSFNNGHGSLTKLAADGSFLSGDNGFAGGGLDFPQWVAIDSAGNAWTANFANSSLSQFSPGGNPVSPAGGYTGGGLSFPVGLAFDPSGTLWVANQGANDVSQFSPQGVPLSPAAGYTGGGIDVPQSVAVDANGKVWFANQFGTSLTELDGQGQALSPSSGYTGGGLDAPAGVAIDGSGNIWVTNFGGNSISEFSGSSATVPGTPLTPASGYAGGGLLQPFSPAIDSAGNLWTANSGNDSLTEFVGLAAPVKTPLIGPPTAP